MNRIILSLIVWCALGQNAFSQSDETLITMGDTKVSKGEFERIYQKIQLLALIFDFYKAYY